MVSLMRSTENIKDYPISRRKIELYRITGNYKIHYLILMDKMPNERLSTKRRKFYKTEKQAIAQFESMIKIRPAIADQFDYDVKY